MFVSFSLSNSFSLFTLLHSSSPLAATMARGSALSKQLFCKLGTRRELSTGTTAAAATAAAAAASSLALSNSMPPSTLSIRTAPAADYSSYFSSAFTSRGQARGFRIRDVSLDVAAFHHRGKKHSGDGRTERNKKNSASTPFSFLSTFSSSSTRSWPRSARRPCAPTSPSGTSTTSRGLRQRASPSPRGRCRRGRRSSCRRSTSPSSPGRREAGGSRARARALARRRSERSSRGRSSPTEGEEAAV